MMAVDETEKFRGDVVKIIELCKRTPEEQSHEYMYEHKYDFAATDATGLFNLIGKTVVENSLMKCEIIFKDIGSCVTATVSCQKKIPVTDDTKGLDRLVASIVGK